MFFLEALFVLYGDSFLPIASMIPSHHAAMGVRFAECLMEPPAVVEGETCSDSARGLTAVGVALEVDVLVLERAPQPLALVNWLP